MVSRTAAGRTKTPGGVPGEKEFPARFCWLLLVADEQREVVQGAANDGVGSVVRQLERRYVAVPLHEHCQCEGEIVGKLRRRRCCV